MRGLQNWLRTTSVVSFVGLYEPYGDRDIEQYGFKLRRGFLATELRPQALLREAPDYLLRVDTDFENRWPPPRTRPRRSHEDWIASFLDGSLLLLVLEIAAKAWSTSVEALLANGEGSLFGEKLREVIGTDIQGDVEGNVEARIYAPV